MLRHTSPKPRRQQPRGVEACARVMSLLASDAIRRESKAGTG